MRIAITLVVWALTSAAHYGEVATAEVVLDTTTRSLPEQCRPLYGDGTHAWKDCMGVGLR